MSTLATNRRAYRLWGFAIAAIVLAIDLFVKGLVMGPLALRTRPEGQIELLPFFRLTFTKNFGVSLGMFTADSAEMRLALVAVTLTIAIVVLVWMLKERKLGDIAALALVLGGALGNIRDRALYGYVIDYADLHFGEWRPFLIFNIADAAISLGVVIILARALFLREKPALHSDNQESGPAPTADGTAAETK
ncbi:MAG: signal peptidase II [Candidatus Andeanibacterium colombiense]|uniref:Lipoprotein signal peptidase n=1 Tax=Candidatus Andeanibacterium colombiense TaxID=3121345 RepID=A0AAJ6BNN9_9SPHN|nr:MAG: signal peptidase II [Sphingomonadaceae bacterium]